MIPEERIIEDGDVSVSIDVGPVTSDEAERADKLFESITKEVR